MSSSIHRTRRRLREALRAGRQLRGTFVKLPSTDVVEVAAAAGFDFIVVDLEHSTLTEPDAITLTRHADALGFAALVRVPDVDSGMINRLLENGAAGIQLSMLTSRGRTEALIAATRYPPSGGRSISLSNRAAGLSARSLPAYLASEGHDPPLLVGQIETGNVDSIADVVRGLDVTFVGVTDLALSLGLPEQDRIGEEISMIRQGASRAGTAFGGWAANPDAIETLGSCGYVIVGSDFQMLAGVLRETAAPVNPPRQRRQRHERTQPEIVRQGHQLGEHPATRNPSGSEASTLCDGRDSDRSP